MSINFAEIVGKTSDEIYTKGPFPVGVYRGVITKAEHLQSAKNRTDCICFGIKPINVIEADPNELEEFGDWQAYEFKPKAMVSPLTFFMTSEAAASFLIAKNRKTGERSGFLVDVCRLPEHILSSHLRVWDEAEDGSPQENLCLAAIGSELIFTVGHDLAENGRIYAVIKQVAASEAPTS